MNWVFHMQEAKKLNQGADESGELFWLALPAGKTLEVLAKEGGFHYWNTHGLNVRISSPPMTERISFRILRLEGNDPVLEAEVLRRISQYGERPASLYEGIAFGSHYPEFCRSEAPLVMLGGYSGEKPTRRTGYLHGTPETRCIGFSEGSGPWSSKARFLVRV